MSDTIATAAFTEADLIAVRAKLWRPKHRAPPLAKLVAIPHGDPPRYRLRAMPDLDHSQGSLAPIRHTIIYGGPTPFLLPLPQPGGPVEPLAELDRYYREDCEARLTNGQPARSMLEFWRDEILFTSWKWADDFRLSVAREAAVKAWRQRVQEQLDACLLSADDVTDARDAAPAGPDVDVRQLRVVEAPFADPVPSPAPELSALDVELVGNELDDRMVVDDILRLIADGVSQPDAIDRYHLRAPRSSERTTDKQVKDRLRRKVGRELTRRRELVLRAR
jgi:hypothetical protein